MTKEEWKQRVCNSIQQSLNAAKLLHIKTEDGDSLPLVDLLSMGDTIKEGQEEIENLVEQIYFDMESWDIYDQQTAEKDEEIGELKDKLERKVNELVDTYTDNCSKDKRIRELEESLSRLVFLHECEQEGLSSGQPTPGMWFEAVNKASEVLTKMDYPKNSGFRSQHSD